MKTARDDAALGLVGESSKEQGKKFWGTSCCSHVHKYTHRWTANKPFSVANLLALFSPT